MDIIISANEKILNLVQYSDFEDSENLTESEFLNWIKKTQDSEDLVYDEQEYAPSRFNYVEKGLRGWMIYNTLYSSLTRLSEDEYREYRREDFLSVDTKRELINQGALVSSSVDELKQYNLFTKNSAKYNNGRPNITVTPTMECNARCHYCYENGVRKGRMQDSDAEKIIDFIRTLDSSRGIELTWFGGEPLMNQEWMDNFSDRMKAEGIDFSAFIISNGSKIDDDVIEKMKSRWNIHAIQITMDGYSDDYVKIKGYVDQDKTIYYRMLEVFRKLSKAGIAVKIRFNIDKSNCDSIFTAARDISELFKNDINVSCYPAFLTGTGNQMSDEEKIDTVCNIINICGGKFNVNEYLYRLPKTMACYYFQHNAFSIDTNGKVYICERMLGYKENAIGSIYGKFDFANIPREISGKRPECQDCVFLPKCVGGCMDAYLKGDDPCFLDKYVIMAYLQLI